MQTDHNRSEKDFTILLVDDREENLLSLEEMLQGEGRKFIRASSGNDALKMVLRNEQIGLIMLDVQMPGMDGFEVARLLKSNPRTSEISIIFVTAISKEEQYVLKGFEEGAVDYLQKPLDTNVTKAKVNVFEQLYFHQRSLKDAMAQLEKINKQLEQFVFIVAHDLKSPLSGIVTMLSVLEVEPTIMQNNHTKQYIDLLSSAALHLSDMISSILDYSRKSMQQQSVEEVDVHQLVEQIAFLLFPPAHIRIVITSRLPVLRTRKLKLQQVFQNLISNAVKYNDKKEGLIEVGMEDKGEFYEFFVRDNGPGISEEDQYNMFKLFRTGSNVSAKESSTGVGLNIMKVIVEEQGGRIHVASEPGKGSTFYFEWKK